MLLSLTNSMPAETNASHVVRLRGRGQGAFAAPHAALDVPAGNNHVFLYGAQKGPCCFQIWERKRRSLD
jgi:hypothetical protein